jgi:hypothetical protein
MNKSTSLLGPIVTIALSTGLMIAPSAYSASVAVNCTGQARYPGQIVTGTCSNRICFGILDPVSVTASGQCADKSTFEATAATSVEGLIGRCYNNILLAIGSEVGVDLNGRCGADGTFKGEGSIRPQWIFGVCSENGPFSAMVTKRNISIQGTCAAAGAAGASDLVLE